MLMLQYIVLGALGALCRILVQIYRDKKITQTREEVAAELTLGAITGYVVYCLIIFYDWTNHLTALACGFTAPDFIENLLKGWRRTG